MPLLKVCRAQVKIRSKENITAKTLRPRENKICAYRRQSSANRFAVPVPRSPCSFLGVEGVGVGFGFGLLFPVFCYLFLGCARRNGRNGRGSHCALWSSLALVGLPGRRKCWCSGSEPVNVRLRDILDSAPRFTSL